MSSIEKIALALVTVAGLTTLVLPNRKSPEVIKAVKGLWVGSLQAATGQTVKN